MKRIIFKLLSTVMLSLSKTKGIHMRLEMKGKKNP